MLISWCVAKIQLSSIQSLSHVQFFVTPWTAACQASLSITNSRTHVHWVDDAIQPSHPLLSPSFSASGSFPMSQVLAWGGQIIGVSALASVLPMNTQDWSPLEWNTTYLTYLFHHIKKLEFVYTNPRTQRTYIFLLWASEIFSLYLSLFLNCIYLNTGAE